MLWERKLSFASILSLILNLKNKSTKLIWKLKLFFDVHKLLIVSLINESF